MVGGEAGLLRLFCPICMGYHATQAMRTLRCGHMFCDKSILRFWLGQRTACFNRPLTCPTCKRHAEPTRERVALSRDFKDEEALAKFGLILRRVYIEDACYVPQGDTAETVYLENPETDDSRLPKGVSESEPHSAYSADVLKKAKEVSTRFRSIDSLTNAEAVQRAGDDLRQMMGMMDWEHEDPILDLFGTLHSFIVENMTNAFKMVAQKDSALRSKDRKLAQVAERNEVLKAEAEQVERVLDEAIRTASQATEELQQTRLRVKELEEGRGADKRRIMDLQGTIQTAKSTESRLRKRLMKYDSERKELQTELASVRQSIEEQKQENEGLRRQSTYHQAYSDYEDGASEFIEGSSLGDYHHTEDADSQYSRSFTPSSQWTSDSGTFVKVPPQRPQFRSDWMLPSSGLGKRKRIDGVVTSDPSHGAAGEGSERRRGIKKPGSAGLPLQLDSGGRPLGLVHLGPRTKLNKHN